MQVFTRLRTDHPPVASLDLAFLDVPFSVHSNSSSLVQALSEYFAPYRAPRVSHAQTILALQVCPDHVPDLPWREVPREDASRRVKEAFVDVRRSRLIRKMRTGVLIEVAPGEALIVGDLLTHQNQVVNLITTLFGLAMLRRGYRLIHAAGVADGGMGIAIAAASGKGKSTAALRLVGRGYVFLSNDRLLLAPPSTVDGGGQDGLEVIGYPKWPRVNPGTLLHDPHLRILLTTEDAADLAVMTAEELWRLERKHDVDVARVYGPARIALRARLRHLILLDWQRDGIGWRMRRLSLDEGLSFFPVFHKDSGVYDLDHPGDVRRPADPVAHRSLLAHLAIWVVEGMADFDRLADAVDRISAGIDP